MGHDEALDKRIEDQIQRMCDNGFFKKKPMQLRLLLGLLARDATNRFNAGESGAGIVEDIYKEIYGVTRFAEMEDPAGDGKKVIEKLRPRLGSYYKDHPGDPVVIKIPSHTLQPDVEFIEVPNGAANAKGDVHGDFKYIGRSKEALAYLVGRLRNATCIQDTTVRWNVARSGYGGMQEFVAALRHSKADFISVTGAVQDNAYVDALHEAFGERADGAPRPVGRLRCFRLYHVSPFMNFVLIHGDEQPTEALFGFGTQLPGQSDDEAPVFCSSNKHLVDEFQRLFWVLCSNDYSKEISVDDPEFRQSHKHKCEVLATFEDGFPEHEIKERIRDCRGKKIVICTTAWPTFDSFRMVLMQALKHGCTVDIAFWKEDSTFALLRSIEVRDPNDFKSTIASNRVTLRDFRKNNNFHDHWCDGQGSVTLFWIDDLMYFSPYWAGARASEGPHFMVHADSDIGRYLQRQFQNMLVTSGKDRDCASSPISEANDRPSCD
jgi:hypothetical protein